MSNLPPTGPPHMFAIPIKYCELGVAQIECGHWVVVMYLDPLGRRTVYYDVHLENKEIAKEVADDFTRLLADLVKIGAAHTN